MRVLIFEPEHGGHRLQYGRTLFDALMPLSVEIVFVTNAMATSLSPVYMGADIMFSKDLIPPIGAALFFALGKDLLKSRWI